MADLPRGWAEFECATALTCIAEIEPIDAYLDIGVGHGGTLEYFGSRASKQVSVGLPPIIAKDPIGTIIVGDSHDEEVIAQVRSHAPFGLVVIDGDPEDGGKMKDFEAYGAMIEVGIILTYDADPFLNRIFLDYCREHNLRHMIVREKNHGGLGIAFVGD